MSLDSQGLLQWARHHLQPSGKQEGLRIQLLREEALQKPNPQGCRKKLNQAQGFSVSAHHKLLGRGNSTVECLSVPWGICAQPWPLSLDVSGNVAF